MSPSALNHVYTLDQKFCSSGYDDPSADIPGFVLIISWITDSAS